MKSDWVKAKLGDVCMIERGGSPRPITDYLTDSPDGINWIKIGDAVEGSKYITSTSEKIKPEGMKKSRFVKKGDFILSNSMSFGKPYILGIDGCIHDGWLVIRDKENVFDKSFLYYYLGSERMYRQFEKLAAGGVVKNLNSHLVRNVDVVIPPIEEQQRIVDELDLLTGIIDKKSAQLRDLDALAQSIFYEMFGDPEALRLKNTLGEVCSIVGRIGFRGYTRDDFVDGPEYGAISLSPANIINSEMNYDKCSYITWEKYDESPEIMIEDGDILVVKTGSSYGKTALVEGLPHKATINPQFVVLKQLSVDNEYLTAYLSTPFARRKYEEYVIGTAIPTFSQKKLASMPLLIPSTADQKRFSSAMSGIRNERRLIKQALEDNKSLLNSRMDFYFTD